MEDGLKIISLVGKDSNKGFTIIESDYVVDDDYEYYFLDGKIYGYISEDETVVSEYINNDWIKATIPKDSIKITVKDFIVIDPITNDISYIIHKPSYSIGGVQYYLDVFIQAYILDVHLLDRVKLSYDIEIHDDCTYFQEYILKCMNKLNAKQKGDKMEQRRNLAFYKEDKSLWTLEEYNNIMVYVGDCIIDNESFNLSSVYIFDDGAEDYFMYTWSEGTLMNALNKCTKVSYESVFGYKDGIEIPSTKTANDRLVQLEKEVEELKKIIKELQ